MRFFSLIPAVLFAVTGFTAAAPSATSSNSIVQVQSDPIAAVTSIITGLTAQLQDLQTKLSDDMSTTPIDSSQVILIITNLTDCITAANGLLEKVVPEISPSSPRLTDLVAPAIIMLNTLDSISGKLTFVVVAVLNTSTTDGTSAETNLIASVKNLVNCLQQFNINLTGGILPPTMDIVDSLVNDLVVVVDSSN